MEEVLKTNWKKTFDFVLRGKILIAEGMDSVNNHLQKAKRLAFWTVFYQHDLLFNFLP